MRSWLRGAAAIVSGTALWLSLGALAFSDRSPSADRIGALPHLGWLAVTLALAGVAAWAAPMRWVWLLLGTAIVWLPWLPGHVPAVALLWVGPVLGAVATAGVLVALGLSERPWPAGFRLWFVNPRRARIAAFLAAAALYAVGPACLDEYTPGGDEPHYLVIAQSLLRDGDLRIENNHREGHYWEYFSGELRPDYLNRGVDGEIYSVHAPGVSALVAPAYALGGYAGVTVFLILLSAWGTSLAWSLAFRVTGRADAAWFGWATVAWSAPWVFHAFTVYPDGPGAVFVLIGLWGLLDDRATPWRRAAQGAAVAFLPWMHTRYAILAAAIGIGMLVRDRRRSDRAVLSGAFLAVPLVSAASWFLFFRLIYGTFDPAAPYGGWTRTGTSLTTLVQGLPALLFDQQFGLVANAPVFAFAFAGLWVLIRRHDLRQTGWECAAIALPYGLQAASYPMWWGGYSAPARFLVPSILVLAVPAAALWAFARHRATRVFALAALGLSWFITGAMLLVGPGRLVYNNRDGFALWVEWVSPLADLNAGLPSFHRHHFAVAMTHVAMWVAALALAWVVARAATGGLAASADVEAGDDAHGPRDLIALGVLAMGVAAAVNAVWQQTGSSGIGVTSSQAWMLRTTSTRSGLVSVRYPDGQLLPRVAPLDAGLSRLQVTSNPRRLTNPAPVLLVRELPAGRYRVHVPLKAGAAGELQASIGRTSMVADRWALSAGPNAQEFQTEIELPVPVHSITLTADAGARDKVGAGWLEPLHMGSSLTPTYNVRAVRAIRYGASLVFFPNDDAFMEPTGFWLRPELSTDVVLFRPEGAHEGADAPARIFLRNGPVENAVSLELGSWSQSLTLQPGEERDLETGITLGTPQVLRARTSAGFRPSEVDPSSDDVRRLSCWVEVR